MLLFSALVWAWYLVVHGPPHVPGQSGRAGGTSLHGVCVPASGGVTDCSPCDPPVHCLCVHVGMMVQGVYK